MQISGQLHAPASLPQGKRKASNRWMRGWVGSRASLDAVARRKNPSHFWESNPDRPTRRGVHIRLLCVYHLTLVPLSNILCGRTKTCLPYWFCISF